VPGSGPWTIAVDAGTSSVRALAVDDTGAVRTIAQRPLTQHLPRPGWVEHDPDEILAAATATLVEVGGWIAARQEPVAAIGLTNQRETVVAWDLRDGRAVAPAMVWQDRRTAARCRALEDAGALPEIRARTGLVLDPYFSATKMAWLLERPSLRDLARRGRLALATVDTWLTWNLTGGPGKGAYITDPTNASRTMLFDIVERQWSAALCDRFHVPVDALAEVRPTSGRVGTIAPDLAATTGVEGPDDVARYLLAGADVVMTTSALLRHGPQHARVLLDGLAEWMARKGFTRLDDFRGRLAVPSGTDATAHARAGYVAALRAANASPHGPW